MPYGDPLTALRTLLGGQKSRQYSPRDERIEDIEPFSMARPPRPDETGPLSWPSRRTDAPEGLMVGQNPIEQLLGIERGSKLDVLSPSNIPIPDLSWRTLAKAPQPAQAPSPGSPRFSFQTPATAGGPRIGADPRQFQAPSVEDIRQADPLKGGSMTIDRSRGLNVPETLANISQFQRQAAAPRLTTVTNEQGRSFQMPRSEELYRQAFADPGTVAPGASEFAQEGLRQEIGDVDFDRLLAQKRQEMEQTTFPTARLENLLGMESQAAKDTAAMQRLERQEQGLTERGQQMYDFYGKQGPGGLPISRIGMPTRTGGGSISFATPSAASQQIPPAVLKDFKDARFALENSRGMMGNADPALQANFDQALLGVLQRYPAPMDVKQTVRFIMSHPTYSQATSGEQVIQAMIQAGDITNPAEVTPQEIMQIDEILSLLQGRF